MSSLGNRIANSPADLWQIITQHADGLAQPVDTQLAQHSRHTPIRHHCADRQHPIGPVCR